MPSYTIVDHPAESAHDSADDIAEVQSKWSMILILLLGPEKPGVGLVVRVAAWDPRVLSSSPVGR